MADLLKLTTDSDSEYCLKCGSRFLDTGWECTDCGYDNMPWYYPKGVERKPDDPALRPYLKDSTDGR